MTQISERKINIELPEEVAARMESDIPLEFFEGGSCRSSVFRRLDGKLYLNFEVAFFWEGWQSVFGLDEENLPQFMDALYDAQKFMSETK